MQKLVWFGVAAAICSSAGLAQRGARLGGGCRQEVMQLCGQSGDRQAIRACVIRDYAKLSGECQQKLRERMEARRNQAPTASAPGKIEMAYGSDPKQRLDYWPAQNRAPAQNRPNTRPALIVFVHGGGWSIGDKSNGTEGKDSYYSGMGYGFASLNYRLVPNARPDGQAADIAAALASLRRDATKLGFDPDRIILMGHSAGAHLAALVSSDPRYLAAAGVPMNAIRGTVLLDGAGYDVAAQMAYKGNRVASLYDAAFGQDSAYQKAMSPTVHAAAPNVGNWLMLYVASREDSAAQSTGLAKALDRAGAKTTVTAIPDSSHMSVNKDAGTAGSFVAGRIEAFLKTVL